MKKSIIVLIVLGIIILIVGILFWSQGSPEVTPGTQNPATTTPTTTATTTEPTVKPTEVIGTSVQNRAITAYHYGTGSKEVLFVGGIHGGYEWNTTLAAYELMDYLAANPSVVPANVKVTVIPVLNPDGLNKVVGTTSKFAAASVPKDSQLRISGRFNANNVDLNRNFDCDWQAKGTWQNTPVSGGTQAFSEPESQAMKAYVEANNPAAVIVWYSAAGGVFASNCHDGVSTATRALMNTFAKASGYKAYESFDFYATTGDMVNWLAKNNIPAISVLLTDHQNTEWSKNKAGVEAVLKSLAQ